MQSNFPYPDGKAFVVQGTSAGRFSDSKWSFDTCEEAGRFAASKQAENGGQWRAVKNKAKQPITA